MEPIITLVGFLGSGKTTVLKRLVVGFIEREWKPFVVLNDYENAYLDAHQLEGQIEPNWLKPLSGSCICCSGIAELRESVNNIPERQKGITVIEANGTSDACSLSGFLGVGVRERFLPPVQVSVVDVKNWQKRGEHNDLEKSQIMVSSLIVLTHLEQVSDDRINEVIVSIMKSNRFAEIIRLEDLHVELLPKLLPSKNILNSVDHEKFHWASCSADLPIMNSENQIREILNSIPKSVLRVKGCVKLGKNEPYTFFERLPDGKVLIRPFHGEPITGSKILTIGPGSDSNSLNRLIDSIVLEKS